MKTYTQEQLTEILAKHDLWSQGKQGGERANLSRAYLSDANLSDADLSGANLSDANLSRANLSDANLSGAYLSDADLSDAYLSDADLSDADLSDAYLSDADLRGANLRGANLSRANLRGADLSRANLSDDQLKDIVSKRQIVPEIGPFYGYKKLQGGAIALLYVPASAQRVGGLIGRKCRVSKAKVKQIWLANGSEAPADFIGRSQHNSDFTYKVGQWVKPQEEFNADVREECTSGIHLFITRKEVEDY